MSFFAPIMNPIRFYPVSSEPDYQDTFPYIDRLETREKWIEGIYPAKYYKDYLINKEISLQFAFSGLTNTDIVVSKPDGTTDIIKPTEITPAGWVSTQVYKYDYTPTLEGVYQMTFTEPNYKSDKIYVASKEKFRRRLVEISYYNSSNKYDMVFFNGDLQKYTGLTYFTGKLMPGQPENEISAFPADSGYLRKLNATPVRVNELTLSDIYIGYIDMVNIIFSCDNIEVNGVGLDNNEAPKIKFIEKTDLCDITIKLINNSNNHYVIE